MTLLEKRHCRLAVASILLIILAAISVANGFIISCARRDDYSRCALMMSSSTKMTEGYEYIHPDIAQMLIGDELPCEENEFPFAVDPDTLMLQLKQHHGADSLEDGTIMPINQLRHFANHCDDVVFEGNSKTLNVQKKIQGLICLSQLSSSERNSAIVVASMVSVNLLESSIRSVLQSIRPKNKNQIKGAPLLSNMIEEMTQLDSDPSFEYNKLFPLAQLSPILKTLLLPTKVGGINLRNLLSHGFLSTLDRRWLSLTLVLIQNLDYCCVSGDETKMTTKQQRDISCLTKYDLMKSEIDYGRALLCSRSRMQELESVSCSGDFVPSSHQNLFRFTLHELGTTCNSSTINSQTTPVLTTIFITSMSSLLEHSLRLVWCRVNDRMEDSIARPASYYVTLDGHGQKDRHEVMISPYLSDEFTRNKLVNAVGAQTCALLIDLFASPSSSDAPNIRAAVCHGYFDDAILEELASLAEWDAHCEQIVALQVGNGLNDAACAMMSALDLISSELSGTPRLTEYKPLFTYTSMSKRDLDSILDNLSCLSLLMKQNAHVSDCIDKMTQQHSNTFADVSSMVVDLGKIHSLAHDLFPSLSADSAMNKFRTEDFYADHNTNLILVDCNAAQTLVADLSVASTTYLKCLEAGVDGLKLEPTSTKDRRAKKSLVRLCGVSKLVLEFHSIATYVALFAIDHCNRSKQLDCNLDRSDVIKAVERSRMTLSTFDAYLSTNMERSIKSLNQYLQGKSVKKILLHNQRH